MLESNDAVTLSSGVSGPGEGLRRSLVICHPKSARPGAGSRLDALTIGPSRWHVSVRKKNRRMTVILCDDSYQITSIDLFVWYSGSKHRNTMLDTPKRNAVE